MARAKLREIILSDALPSLSKKPGPAERRLESYLSLSSALRAKELISQWLPTNHPQSNSDLQLRDALTRTLADHSHFGYIRRGSKLPQSHPRAKKPRYSVRTESGFQDFLRPNGTDWLGSPTAPRSGNWSVIPKSGSRLLIFDLDVRKTEALEDGTEIPTSSEARYLEGRRSIGHLEALLGVRLQGTYAQLSPSGGVHIFLLLPEGTDPRELPSAKLSDGMRSLAGVPRELWSSELRGDIRSGASNGFILMAGSELTGELDDPLAPERYYRPLVSDPRWSDFKDYRSARKLRLLELPESAVQRLREARALDLELRASTKFSGNALDRAHARTGAPSSGTEVIRRELQPGSYSRILKRLENESPRSFHESRAQLYRALSCCGSPQSIATICAAAGYGKDSYSGRELSEEELLADMEAMERRGLRSTRCGSHCGSSRVGDSSTSQRGLELAALSESIRSSKLEGLSELSALGYRRVQDSSLLEARAQLEHRDRRDGSYGVYGKRRPRGLDYRAVAVEILGERVFSGRLRGLELPVAGYRLRALELALGYFAPLFAAGAPLAIASTAELTRIFGWSESQLREALRHLRASGVISLERRQVSGRASAYGPGKPRFFDRVLSKRLRSSWGSSEVISSTGERAFLGGFFDYSRGRIVRPDGTSYTDGYLREVGGGFTGLLQELSIELPRVSRISASVVRRYLAKALARYIEVSSSTGEALDALSELGVPATGLPTSRDLSEYALLTDHLWISSRAFREHSFAGTLSGSVPRVLGHRGSRGDRSPPDPGEPPNSTNITEEQRKGRS